MAHRTMAMPARAFSAASALMISLAAFAQQAATTIEVHKTARYGPHLTDAQGRALYLFTADRQGQGDAKAVSDCYDACAHAWPPLLATGKVKAATATQDKLLGTLQRKDGSTQVTYNGWPLYYFVKDKGPGQATGQDVHGFGGEWYLLTPQGTKLQGQG